MAKEKAKEKEKENKPKATPPQGRMLSMLKTSLNVGPIHDEEPVQDEEPAKVGDRVPEALVETVKTASTENSNGQAVDTAPKNVEVVPADKITPPATDPVVNKVKSSPGDNAVVAAMAVKEAEVKPVKKAEVTRPTSEDTDDAISENDVSTNVEKPDLVANAGEEGVAVWFNAAEQFFRDGTNNPIHVIVDKLTAERIQWAEEACGFNDGRKSRKLVIAAMAEFFFAHHGKEIQNVNERKMREKLRKMKVR